MDLMRKRKKERKGRMKERKRGMQFSSPHMSQILICEKGNHRNILGET